MREISEEEALFLSKLQMIGISFELSLAILSEMRRTGGDIPKEKYESWGFADAFSMGYVELQYQLTQEGMTVEQVDYLESDARFSLALQVTAINLAIAGIKIIGQIASSEQADPELESQITTKFENKIISNKGNVYNNRPALIHTSTKKNPGYQGVPNSSVDILDSKTGKIKTRRWFGPDGKAERDLDMTNHNNPKMHPEVPHEHLWEYAADGTPIRR